MSTKTTGLFCLLADSTHCMWWSRVILSKVQDFYFPLLNSRSVHICSLLKFLWNSSLLQCTDLFPRSVFSTNLLGTYSLPLFWREQKTKRHWSVGPSLESQGMVPGTYSEFPFRLLIAALWACPANFPLILQPMNRNLISSICLKATLEHDVRSLAMILQLVEWVTEAWRNRV